MSYAISRPPPGDLASLRQWLVDELGRLAQETVEPAVRAVRLKKLNAEPARRYDGLTVYADGTNWNPTAGGEGAYIYYAGAWHKLG